MRVIAHISDLHFGHNDPLRARSLVQALTEINPHVLVVSGDLVEHATDREFVQVREFLKLLPRPQVIVPGNHDLAFYNLFQRFSRGLDKYRRYISDDLSPSFTDSEVAILGAKSAHLYPVKGGRLSHRQLDEIVEYFSAIPPDLVRVLVTHHPFDLPAPANSRLLIGDSRRAVSRLAPVVDILLAGHIHLSSSGSTRTRYRLNGHSMIFVQAGTALSDRFKGEVNSFNVIRTALAEGLEKKITVERYTWLERESGFQLLDSTDFSLEAV